MIRIKMAALKHGYSAGSQPVSYPRRPEFLIMASTAAAIRSSDALILPELVWDDELICRYDLSGPRHTSYLTAVEFNQTYPIIKGVNLTRDDRLRRRVTGQLIAGNRRVLQVQPVGRLLIRAICQIFDAYCKEGASQRFSRTV
jgi:hypothetical protein